MESPQIITISFYDSNIGDDALRRKLAPVDEMPSCSFYPYGALNVPGSNTHVFVCATSVDHITPEFRERLVNTCCDYGPENAETGVPSLQELRELWLADNTTFKKA